MKHQYNYTTNSMREIMSNTNPMLTWNMNQRRTILSRFSLSYVSPVNDFPCFTSFKVFPKTPTSTIAYTNIITFAITWISLLILLV